MYVILGEKVMTMMKYFLTMVLTVTVITPITVNARDKDQSKIQSKQRVEHLREIDKYVSRQRKMYEDYYQQKLDSLKIRIKNSDC